MKPYFNSVEITCELDLGFTNRNAIKTMIVIFCVS